MPNVGYKSPVKVTTAGPITLSGPQTVNSVAVAAGDRVLVMHQADTTQNGVWCVQAGAWTRAVDFDDRDDVVNGVQVLDTNSGNVYRANFTAPFIPDTTTITFSVISIDTIQWGDITGTVSSQADLQTALDGKSNTGHTHLEADITDLGNYIEASGVTYENLSANGDIGTGAAQVSQGDHGHAQLHNQSHAMTGASDHTATNWRLFHSNGSGSIVELALGALGTAFQGGGASAAPLFSDDLRLAEKANVNDPTAGYGRFWVKNDSPNGPMFTDDTDDDTPLDRIVLSTSQATTSGTSIDFTSIPAWVKRITIEFHGVSTDGSSHILVQLGDSGGVETTGYLGSASSVSGSVSTSNYTAGFGVRNTNAATVLHGHVFITLEEGSNNDWVASGILAFSNTNDMTITAGSKSLSETLDRVRITTTNGTDAFDAGSINILYEG
jgi:uncharacterized cupin superfamily protein